MRSCVASRGVHDHCYPDQADSRADEVEAVRAEAVEDDAPGQRSGDEDPAVGGKDAPEVRVRLKGRYQTVGEERGPSEQGEPPRTAFADCLPHEIRPSDLGYRGCEEERDGAGDLHSADDRGAQTSPRWRPAQGPAYRP